VNAMGETRLHVAARLNKVRDVVTLLLDGADVNATDYAGLLALGLCNGRVSVLSVPSLDRGSGVWRDCC